MDIICTRAPRCFTCGKVVKWEEYFAKLNDVKEEDYETGSPKDVILDELMIRRICCRRMYLSHPDELEEIIDIYRRNMQ